MIKDIKAEILRLKKENDVCILAHSYQSEDILEVADIVGDSYALAKKAAGASNKTLLLCGVRFMAETAKLLNPGKRVLLSHPDAGCPMAEQFERNEIEALKNGKYKGYTVVAYVNTTTALKSVADVCVTSSSALKIVNALESKNILFIPDCNLGSYVAEQCPDKNVALLKGGCPIHAAMRADDAIRAKALHPGALLLVHPECRKEVLQYADYVGSTAGIMDYAINSDAKEFIIGTENSIKEHLQYKCPDKRFYELSKMMVCHNMKLTTLPDVLACVNGEGGEEITIPEDIAEKAVGCINRMIELGG